MAKLTTSQRIKQDKPIEIWESPDGSWVYKVYRKYQKPANEAKNPHARWFCGTRSPFTYGDFELGDGYVRDIKRVNVRTFSEDEPDA